MKIRTHHGSLRESLISTKVVDNTEKSIREYLLEESDNLLSERIKNGKLEVKFYCDEPIVEGWLNHYIILIDDYLFGFCDENITSKD